MRTLPLLGLLDLVERQLRVGLDLFDLLDLEGGRESEMRPVQGSRVPLRGWEGDVHLVALRLVVLDLLLSLLLAVQVRRVERLILVHHPERRSSHRSAATHVRSKALRVELAKQVSVRDKRASFGPLPLAQES